MFDYSSGFDSFCFTTFGVVLVLETGIGYGSLAISTTNSWAMTELIHSTWQLQEIDTLSKHCEADHV